MKFINISRKISFLITHINVHQVLNLNLPPIRNGALGRYQTLIQRIIISKRAKLQALIQKLLVSLPLFPSPSALVQLYFLVFGENEHPKRG